MTNENELGIKYVSFQLTSSKVITTTTRMNYHNKEDLRFEVLKGVIVHYTMEYECELASAE